MTENLRTKCELFERNRSAVSQKFIFENDVMRIAAGLLLTGAEREADIETLTECRRILSERAGFFSEYRGNVKLALITDMALSPDPEQYLADVKAVYQTLHRGHFRDNSYMLLSAMLICDAGRQAHAEEIAEKYGEILRRMEKQHPIITNAEDISYVILLAMSDRTADAILRDMDECAETLNSRLRIGADSVQGLSEYLALSDGDIREKCDRIVRLYDALKSQKASIGSGNALIALGTMANLDEPAETLVSDILEADAFLAECKGFDEKSMDKRDRLMTAVILTAESRGTAVSAVNNTFINSALGIIRAKHLVTVITVISHVLPPLIDAAANMSGTDTEQAPQQDVHAGDGSAGSAPESNP